LVILELLDLKELLEKEVKKVVKELLVLLDPPELPDQKVQLDQLALQD